MEKRILIVDDEECIRYTFGNFLMENGYRVTEAASFEEAVRLLGGQPFDLVIIDVILPGKSGLDLLKRVREARPALPVVIITGGPNEKTAAEVRRLGAVEYLIKPVRQELLLQVAHTVLN